MKEEPVEEVKPQHLKEQQVIQASNPIVRVPESIVTILGLSKA